jgi:hypothetical protein
MISRWMKKKIAGLKKKVFGNAKLPVAQTRTVSALSELEMLRDQLTENPDTSTQTEWTVIKARRNSDGEIIRSAVLRSRVESDDKTTIALGPYIVANETEGNRPSYSVYTGDEVPILESLAYLQTLNDKVLTEIKNDIALKISEATKKAATQDDRRTGDFVTVVIKDKTTPPFPSTDNRPGIVAKPSWPVRVPTKP